MNKTKLAFTACSLSMLLLAGYAVAQEEMKQGFVVIRATELEWKDGPTSLPQGIQLSVLEGDMTKEGPFTVRLRLPKGTKIAPHHHPAIEHVTVLEGDFSIGDGEKWNDKALRNLEQGSFVMMEKGHRHFAMSKKGAVIQLHGIGPWGITYVNPADDPSRRASK